MGTITLPNVRACSDTTFRVSLSDNGVAVDWSGLSDIKALIYSDDQKAVAGRCSVSVDGEDSTILVCEYAATKPQYLGVNSIVVQAKYHGRTKTYDKAACNFVARTAEVAGDVVEMDDPVVPVAIDVEDVSTSLLDAAIAAAFDAAENATHLPTIIEGYWALWNPSTQRYDVTEYEARGPEGASIRILDELEDVSDLPATGEDGDSYIIDGDLWTWTSTGWKNVGRIQGPQGDQGEPGKDGRDGRDGIMNVIAEAFEDPSMDPLTVQTSTAPIGGVRTLLLSLINFKGDKGDKGDTGEAAGFGSVSAALQEDGGDPSVVVAASGEDTSKNFAFTFKNLKGDKGDKGDQGNTGSSVDYPYELVNNCTTDDATKGLSAAQGYVLDGKVSQLEAKVIGEDIPITASRKAIYLNGGIGTTIPTPVDSSYSYSRFPVSPNDVVIINGTGGGGPRLWGFIDSSEKIISVADSSATASEMPLIAPEGAAEIIINTSDTSVLSRYVGKNYATRLIIGTNESIKNIQQFLFAKNSPFIKELYLTSAGISADVANVHTVTSSFIRFSNTAGNSFVARATKVTNSGILPIYPDGGGTTILGYIVVDWSSAPSNRSEKDEIYDIAKNVDYSPAIREMLNESVLLQELGFSETATISQKVITENFNEINTALNGAEQTAIDILEAVSQVSNTDYVWFIIPNQRISKISKIKFLAREGTITFYKVKYDGVNTPTKETITSVVVNSLQNASIMSIPVSVDLTDDEYIGINGAFFFASVAGNKTRNWNLSTGEVSSVSTQYLFVNAFYEDVNESLKGLETFVMDNNKKVVLYSARLNAENSDLVGTQDIQGGVLRVGTSLVYLNKFYSLAVRTFRAVCKFNSSTVAEFVTVIYNDGTVTSYANRITFNISNRTIKCTNGDTVYCELLQNYNHKFVIDITKKFQENIVRVVDLYSGAEWFHIWKFNGTGGVGGGAIGTQINTGMAWDKYGFQANSGTFNVENIMVFGQSADVVFYGDSITEPEAYWPNNIFDKCWTKILYDKSRGRILSSGRSGTTISSLLGRMQNELPYLKPKAVFVTIGTNGGVSYSSLESLVNYIRSLDIVAYVNHIPANINSGGVSNHATVNAIVDQIRTQMGVTGIDFDKPTSVDYNGGNVNTATMWWEEYTSAGNVYHHPNILGSAGMLSRADVDTPELFSL